MRYTHSPASSTSSRGDWSESKREEEALVDSEWGQFPAQAKRKDRRRRFRLYLAAGLLGVLVFALIPGMRSHATAPLAGVMASLRESRAQPVCTPALLEQGQWRLKSKPPMRFQSDEEVLRYLVGSPTPRCAGPKYEIDFAMGYQTVGLERLTRSISYEWDAGCSLPSLAQLSAVERVQYLIDTGGLLLVGDSLTREAFDLLGCQLGELTQWKTTGEGDAAGLVNDLILDMSSPLISRLQLPAGFDYALPLVTYQRSDLLFSRAELLPLLQKRLPKYDLGSFSDVVPGLFDLPSTSYLDLMADRKRRYSTIVVSTGAHWTLNVLGASSYEDQMLPWFEAGMDEWLQHMSKHLSPSQNLLIRAASTGQEACEQHVMPTADYPDLGTRYNWRFIPLMNQLFESVVLRRSSKQISWIGGERPARLRPDAHLGDDCMHVSLPSGVVEVWSNMMWSAVANA